VDHLTLGLRAPSGCAGGAPEKTPCLWVLPRRAPQKRPPRGGLLLSLPPGGPSGPTAAFHTNTETVPMTNTLAHVVAHRCTNSRKRPRTPASRPAVRHALRTPTHDRPRTCLPSGPEGSGIRVASTGWPPAEQRGAPLLREAIGFPRFLASHGPTRWTRQGHVHNWGR